MGIKLKHLKAAFILLCYTLIGSLFPVWGGSLYLLLSGKLENICNFFIHAEFAIYSVALLAPMFYLFTRNYKENPFSKKPYLFILSLILFLASSIIFVTVMSTEAINVLLLIILTTTFFSFSVLIYFVTNVIENVRQDIDLRKKEKEEIKNLIEKFDKLGE